MHPIAPYARTAYAQGWAASGGPMTGRVKAGCIAAVEHAIEHADDPHILEVMLHLGKLEGAWALIYQRREEQHRKHAPVRACVGGAADRGHEVGPVGKAGQRIGHGQFRQMKLDQFALRDVDDAGHQPGRAL